VAIPVCANALRGCSSPAWAEERSHRHVYVVCQVGKLNVSDENLCSGTEELLLLRIGNRQAMAASTASFGICAVAFDSAQRVDMVIYLIGKEIS
jgi:hypothetical protein